MHLGLRVYFRLAQAVISYIVVDGAAIQFVERGG
jgi:hypothetical protein